jgi:hypothetical protein
MNAMNVSEAAAYTGLSPSFLNKRRVYGGGPFFIKAGKRVVYDQLDLDNWLQRRRVAKTSQHTPIALMIASSVR